jgi:putative DNA primase/helicase
MPNKTIDEFKVPPHSIEAEQSVLGGLMLDNGAWVRIADYLCEADFYRTEHKLIFRAMTALSKRSQPFDVITLAEALKDINELENAGGEVYLFELAKNIPSVANIEAYSNIVAERSKLRKLVQSAEDIKNAAFAGNFDTVSQQIPNILTSLASISSEKGAAVYRYASDIEPKPINWLWPNHIAKGKTSMIVGDPDLGKSQLTVSLAAIVSTGGSWPISNEKSQQGKVIILSAEDDAEDTIVPRLKAAGAELSNIIILDGISNDFDEQGNAILRHFNFTKDLTYLNNLLTKNEDVALVLIDPITSYLGSTDAHKNADIRGVLAPIAKMAERHNVAIICISHLNKNSNQQALLRVSGSLAFVAASRATYLVVRDKNNENRRLFLPLKNNLSPNKTGLAFTIESCKLSENIETSRIVWLPETVTTTADEALAPQNETGKSTLEEAKEFLCDLLNDGSVSQNQINIETDSAGFSQATIRRAKKELGIISRKVGMDDGWIWSLPPKMLKNAEDAQDAHTQNLSTFGKNEHLRQNNSTNADQVRKVLVI